MDGVAAGVSIGGLECDCQHGGVPVGTDDLDVRVHGDGRAIAGFPFMVSAEARTQIKREFVPSAREVVARDVRIEGSNEALGLSPVVRAAFFDDPGGWCR